MSKGDLFQMKATIRSLIISSNDQLTILKLKRDYESIVGEPFPTTGFKNAEHLLRSIPDVVKIIGTGPDAIVEGVRSEKSEHIIELVKQQRTNDNRNRRWKRVRHRGRTDIQHLLSNSMHEDSSYARGVFDYELTKNKSMTSLSNFVSTESSDSNEFESKQPACVRQVPLVQNFNIENDEKEQGNVKTICDSQTNNKENMMAADQKEKVLNKRFNILIASFNNENNNHPTSKSNTFPSGRMHLLEKVVNNSKIDSALLSARSTILKDLPSPQTDAVPADAVTDDEHDNRPTSKSNTLPFRRMQLYETMLDNSEIDAAAVPTDAMTKEIDHVKTNSEQITENQHKFNVALDIHRCTLYDYLQQGSIFSLYISEIHSPTIFFFHITKENHELLKLQEIMRITYSKIDNDLLSMTYEYLEPGNYCVVKQEHTWFRAKILHVPDRFSDFGKIKILLVDYGRITVCSKTQLKLLLWEFSIPIQVACARLSHIERNERSDEAIECFKEITENKCLDAYVVKINEDKTLFDLILVDANVTPKCNVNEKLIKMGFAKFKTPNS